MLLKHLSLQNFRSHLQVDFSFNRKLTVVVGENASGKSNLVESIYLLATGQSRRTDQDKQLIHFDEKFCRVKGIILEDGYSRGEKLSEELEAVFSVEPNLSFRKKYLVNGVGKRRVDFAGRLVVVQFSPLDLEIVIGQPSQRRRFLDEVLEQVDYDYRSSLSIYTKALRQRNALLDLAQKSGRRQESQFGYWDEILIRNGQFLSRKREELIGFINNRHKELFSFVLEYDQSVISSERLLQYRDAEIGAGVTLVGPHRDEVKIVAPTNGGEMEAVKFFSSRGQQRLVVLELKLSQIFYAQERLGAAPLLLLDDIFSELDAGHIRHVMEAAQIGQTIITTTHSEFVQGLSNGARNIIELRKV
jgi:DNA replication and repair protein RecF